MSKITFFPTSDFTGYIWQKLQLVKGVFFLDLNRFLKFLFNVLHFNIALDSESNYNFGTIAVWLALHLLTTSTNMDLIIAVPSCLSTNNNLIFNHAGWV